MYVGFIPCMVRKHEDKWLLADPKSKPTVLSNVFNLKKTPIVLISSQGHCIMSIISHVPVQKCNTVMLVCWQKAGNCNFRKPKRNESNNPIHISISTFLFDIHQFRAQFPIIFRHCLPFIPNPNNITDKEHKTEHCDGVGK